MILSPTELRIGNLIDVFGECEVTTIGQKNIGVLRTTETGFLLEKVPLNSLSLKPIPITHKMIKKLGFDSSNPLLFYNYDSGAYYLSDTNIKYVHQLQNLYFALTGKELCSKQE